MQTHLLRLQQIVQRLPRAANYHLAFSGGLDSSVLLHMLVKWRSLLPGRLQVVHVQHGLHEDAESWAEHCARVCITHGLPLQQQTLRLSPQAGESVEALARDRRYQALASLMQAGDVLLTAQHQDDQAETLLLQLLRGSGPAGLAAMPQLCRFGPGWLARPLLEISRAELVNYAKEYRLRWVEDPSNRDLRYDRNYLREQVMPLLLQRWPAATATIARAARLSGELQALADALAAEDLQQARGPWPDTLSITALRKLPSARRRSLLRHWVRELGGGMPGSRHLQRIEQECLHSRQDAKPLVKWQDMEVRRFRDGLFLRKARPPHDISQVIPWQDGRPLQLPDGSGELVLEEAQHGLSKRLWGKARVEIRYRQGGERCIPAGNIHHRALKKLFQEWSIPPWLRDSMPLIYLDNQLAAIPGYVVCESFQAKPGEPALRVRWNRSQS